MMWQSNAAWCSLHSASPLLTFGSSGSRSAKPHRFAQAHVVTVGDVGAAIPIQQQPVGTERIVVESWFPFRWRRCQDAQRQIENSRFVDALVWRDERHAPTFESEAGYEQLPAQHLPVQLPLGAQASRTPRAARADQGRHGRHHTARCVGSRTAAPYHLIPIYYSPDYTAANDDFDTTRKATWVAASLLSAPIDGVALVGRRRGAARTGA